MDILAMKTRDGEPGLFAAMENNHPLCFTRFLSKVYGIAVKYKLSKINIMDLLKARQHMEPCFIHRHEQG